MPNARQVGEQQDRGHEHRDRDGQAVGRLHVARALEEEHHADAGHPHNAVNEWDVDLTARLGGVVDLHVRKQVKADGLRHDGVGARDQGL